MPRYDDVTGEGSRRTDDAKIGKMSPQAAVGPGCWPDEDGRQTKHRRASKRGRGKESTARTHRDGSRR